MSSSPVQLAGKKVQHITAATLAPVFSCPVADCPCPCPCPMPIFHRDRVVLITPAGVGAEPLLRHFMDRAAVDDQVVTDAAVADLRCGTLHEMTTLYPAVRSVTSSQPAGFYTIIRVVRDPFCRAVDAAISNSGISIAGGTGGACGYDDQYVQLCAAVSALFTLDPSQAPRGQAEYWDDPVTVSQLGQGSVATVRCESLARDARALPRAVGAGYSGPVSGSDVRLAEFRHGPLLDMVEARYAADFEALGYPVRRRLVEVVVARYREDLAWLASVCGQPTLDYDHAVDLAVHVYDKSDGPGVDAAALADTLVSARTGVPVCTAAVVRRANVGREADTYLAHMLTHGPRYRARPNDVCVVFVQGCVDDHLFATQLNGQPPGRAAYTCGSALVAGLAADACTHASGTALTHAADHAFGPHSATPGFTIAEWRGHVIQPLPRSPDGTHMHMHTLGTWYRDRTGRAWPVARPVRWWVAALFAASAERIATIPPSLIQALLCDLQDNDNPVAAHFLERTWALLLTEYL